MKEWREDFSNPLVKGVTGFALCTFLALNFPVVFLTIVAAALCYAVALVSVAYAYRNAIVGKSELAVRFVQRTTSGFKEGCSRTVAHAIEQREKRKLHKRKKEERLRRYKRERNGRKREHAKRALEQR